MALSLDLSTILSGLILTGVVGIFTQLRRLNGRLLAMETWRDGHVKSDDERHARTEETRRDLWGAIDELRKRPAHALCRIGRQAAGLAEGEN